MTNQPTGECTITYKDAPTQILALQTFDGQHYNGMPIRVTPSIVRAHMAKPPPPPPPGSRGRGRGRGGPRGRGGGDRGGRGRGGRGRDNHHGNDDDRFDRDGKKDKFPNYLEHIPPEDDPLATRTLFTGNLELNITDEEIKRIFGRYGNLLDIDIKRPPPGKIIEIFEFCRHLTSFFLQKSF